MKDFIAGVVALGLAVTTAGAHETVIETKQDGKTKVVKIVTHGDGDDAKGGAHESVIETERDGQRKIVKIVRHGDGDTGKNEIQIKGCEGGEAAADIDEDVTKDGKRERQRILICSKPGDADAAKRLSQARERIAKDDYLSAEIKAKVLASLDAAIARQSKP